MASFLGRYGGLGTNTSGGRGVAVGAIVVGIVYRNLGTTPGVGAALSFGEGLIENALGCRSRVSVSVPAVLSANRVVALGVRSVKGGALRRVTSTIGSAVEHTGGDSVGRIVFRISVSGAMGKLGGNGLGRALYHLFNSGVPNGRGIRALSNRTGGSCCTVPRGSELAGRSVRRNAAAVSGLNSIYEGRGKVYVLLRVVPPRAATFTVGTIRRHPIIIASRFKYGGVRVHSVVPVAVTTSRHTLSFNSYIPFLGGLSRVFTGPRVVCR